MSSTSMPAPRRRNNSNPALRRAIDVSRNGGSRERYKEGAVLRGPHPRLWGALAGAPRSGGAKLALRETPPPPPASEEEFVPSPAKRGRVRCDLSRGCFLDWGWLKESVSSDDACLLAHSLRPERG